MTAYDRPEYACFVNYIRESPDDDLPRLICADWLEENGETERAEFIRLQCEMDRKVPCGAFLHSCYEHGNRCLCGVRYGLQGREAELESRNEIAWAVAFSKSRSEGRFFGDPGIPNFTWVRGFLDSVRMPVDQWAAHADALLREHPVRTVTLTYSDHRYEQIIDYVRGHVTPATGDEIVIEVRFSGEDKIRTRTINLGGMGHNLKMVETTSAEGAIGMLWPEIAFTFERADLDPSISPERRARLRHFFTVVSEPILPLLQQQGVGVDWDRVDELLDRPVN